MATVLVINGRVRLMIRSKDHKPPHVHAEYGTGRTKSHAKIEIETLEVFAVKNFTRSSDFVKKHRDELMAAGS